MEEETTVIRFLVPVSWKRRANKLGDGYGGLSELGRRGFIRELQEEEKRRRQEEESAEQEPQARAS